MMILKLASDEGQARVDEALRLLLDCSDEISAPMIAEILSWDFGEELRADVFVAPADLGAYDLLLEGVGSS